MKNYPPTGSTLGGVKTSSLPCQQQLFAYTNRKYVGICMHVKMINLSLRICWLLTCFCKKSGCSPSPPQFLRNLKRSSRIIILRNVDIGQWRPRETWMPPLRKFQTNFFHYLIQTLTPPHPPTNVKEPPKISGHPVPQEYSQEMT